MSDLLQRVTEIARTAKKASRALALAPTAVRDAALCAAAQALRADEAAILEANAKDLAAAKAKGLTDAMTDRLRLDHARLEDIAVACEAVAKLPDPVGEVTEDWTRPNGLRIIRRRVPIGLVAIIFESRPNVTVDAAALCLKSGNGCVLRGGSEAIHTNIALSKSFATGLRTAGLPAEAVTLLPFTDREAVPALGSLRGIVDIIVPRGGPGLIEAVVNSAKVPVIKHDAGICHVYVHAQADLAMAEQIVLNAKCQRPSACNALETLLVDAAIAEKFLPKMAAALAAKQTEVRACAQSQSLMPGAKVATEQDYRTEHLGLILNVKIVAGLAAAVAHVEDYGSHHSDAIITADESAARSFLAQVDSACVYWNASTRFTDGGEFGFGAEVGISTDRLHARGPMGIRELTTWKFEIVGQGQVRG
ncbi:MAG: glutamate-5-semialdehyde dehydrogenase [Verrucomicrobia bacterium]|nr:glutamate-5-semialdehyde dehydrogenase [Verrucomicrobiota bacterium]